MNDTCDTVRLTSNGFAFESDNQSFRAASVPERATLVLRGLGLVGVGLAATHVGLIARPSQTL